MASATFGPTTREGNKFADAAEKIKDAGSQAVDKAKEAGAEAFGKVKEAGAQALDKAKDAVGSVGDMAAETACAVGKKADDLTAAAGHEIREFGHTIGSKAPHEGIAGHASQAVADSIKGGGRYIEEAKLSGMAQDVEQVIKNHPIPALLVCLGIGYCLGRTMKM
jgi:ElaB/YqjD/DUF883 family membrane-anchored ribosome-binding protein